MFGKLLLLKRFTFSCRCENMTKNLANLKKAKPVIQKNVTFTKINRKIKLKICLISKNILPALFSKNWGSTDKIVNRRRQT